MSSSFYRPLNRSTNETRLLELYSAEDPTADVVCDLVYTSLDDNVQYVALSYSWGTESRTKEITLDGHQFGVTENLHAALLTLRNNHVQQRCGRFWIDAICINQEDTDERSNEVLRIFQIFENAKQVFVWLGSASADSDVAMDHLSALSRSVAVSNRVNVRFVKSVKYALTFVLCYAYYVVLTPEVAVAVMSLYGFWQGTFLLFWLRYKESNYAKMLIASAIYTNAAPGSPYFWIMRLVLLVSSIVRGTIPAVKYWWTSFWKCYEFEVPGVKPPQPSLISALISLFQREWFSRTWVIQECGAAKDIVVLCGERYLHWDTVMNAVDMIGYVALSSTTRHPYVDIPYFRIQSFNKVRDIEHLPLELACLQRSLLHLINEFSYHNASDPIDKVYGLLGLSTEGRSQALSQAPNRARLDPDYNKTVMQVFTETARFIIESSETLDVLRACLHQGSVQGLPSWVPDWTVKQIRVVGEPAYWQTPFYVEMDNTFPRRPIAKFLSSGQRVVVQGIVVARLDECTFSGRISGNKPAIRTFNEYQMYERQRSGRGTKDAPEVFMTKEFSEPFKSLASWLLVLARTGSIFYDALMLLGGRTIYSYIIRKNPWGFGPNFMTQMMAAMERKQRRRRGMSTVIPRTPEAMMYARADDNNPQDAPTTFTTHLFGKDFASDNSNLFFNFVYTRALEVEVDDLVVMLLGAKVPFIIRPMSGKTANDVFESATGRRSKSGEFRLLGPAIMGGWEGYLHMQTRKAFQQGEFQVETFTLV